MVPLAPAGIEHRDIRVRTVVARAEPPEAAAQGLLDGGEIVGALNGLDPEMAVARGRRPALLEHHHRADRVGAHGVADVVTLDASRRSRELQPRSEIVEQRLGLRGIVVVDDSLLAERDQRGLRGLRDQPPGIAALGDVHLDGAAALLGEELLENRAPLDLFGHEEPPRNRGHVGVILREKPAEARRRIEPGDALELVRLHRHDAPLADAQHRGHGATRLDGNRDAVLVGCARRAAPSGVR